MCPPPSVPLLLDINFSSTDEEILLFLGERKAGDPVPSNIITEVNPFSVEPRDSPEGMWYLYNFEDVCSSNQRNILKKIQAGYWRFMDHLTIYRGNVAAGIKITWEYYTGQEPVGDRTGWLMYDYQRVQKDCDSMCRVFKQEDQKAVSDQKPPDTEHFSPVSSDNADVKHIESILLCFLEPEERIPPANAANQSEIGALEQMYNTSSPDRVTSDSTGMNAFVEFSKGEYLELEDLYDLESTSSSSDDSSLISSNSDECFDAEALLRDLENESGRNIKGEGLNSRFKMVSSAKPSHAAISLSQSAGSHKINKSHSANYERLLSNSSPSDKCSPKTPSPVYKSEQKVSASTSASVSYLRDHPKRTHSGSSERSSSSNGSGSNSAARIAKFGKKYCCFGPF